MRSQPENRCLSKGVAFALIYNRLRLNEKTIPSQLSEVYSLVTGQAKWPDDDAESHRVATAPSRDHCTDTVISEPDAAVDCWSGCTTAALVIFTGKRPVALAWKVRVATTP